MEHENVREDLKLLLEYNDHNLNPDLKVGEPGGPQRKATVEDVQEINSEYLASVADLLGMSELYLGEPMPERREN